MNCRWVRLVPLFAISLSFAWATDAPRPAAPAMKAVSLDMVAKVKVGAFTMDQVAELLGAPLRVINDLDCHVEGYQGESWEYIARDGNNSVKISVQFDHAGVVRLIAKGAGKGPAVVLASAPLPTQHHQH